MLLTYDPFFFFFLPCRLLTPLPQSSSLKEHHACPRCLRWPYRHFPHRCSLILVWAAQPQQDSLQVNIALSAIFIARTIHAEAMMSHLFFFFKCFSSTGMSLSAGSSPLHSPKITPHTSPAPRRRSHTPNPANYMVPTTASEQGGAAHIIQKETVGGTTYFYTDNTPAPMAGMVWFMVVSLLSSDDYLFGTYIIGLLSC